MADHPIKTNQPEESVDSQRRRLHFRSWHRGTKEMDFLLGHFADARLAGLPPDRLAAYDALLAEPDPDLYTWITGDGLPEDLMLKEIVLEIRRYHEQRHDA